WCKIIGLNQSQIILGKYLIIKAENYRIKKSCFSLLKNYTLYSTARSSVLKGLLNKKVLYFLTLVRKFPPEYGVACGKPWDRLSRRTCLKTYKLKLSVAAKA